MIPPLWDRAVDTVAEFEAAALQRLNEAELLLKRSRDLAAIYLYGYSVEMRIKAVYFRNARTQPQLALPITKTDRQNAAKMWTTLGLSVRPDGHHIAGWAELAVAARATTPNPYPVGFGNDIVNNAASLYLIWRETLRYWSIIPLNTELRTVRSIARWFASHHSKMI
jgi:hypothetical protein